jgi:hypothetical protein
MKVKMDAHMTQIQTFSHFCKTQKFHCFFYQILLENFRKKQTLNFCKNNLENVKI